MPLPAGTDATVLARVLEDFFADHPGAAVLEDGRFLFDLRLAHYSVSAEHGRCLLHFWSDERNLVRTITDIDIRRDTVRLESWRFGQNRAQTLLVVSNPDRRTPTARTNARRSYLKTLKQALIREDPEWVPEGFRSALDLEHSFGPAYARGLIRKGHSAWAVLGVGQEEPPAVIDGALTFGILWLAHCRDHADDRRVFQGLKLVIPKGCAATARARMAWLHPDVACWRLLEFEASTGKLSACAIEDDGNLAIQLARAFDPQATLDRCKVAIAHLSSMIPAKLLAATELRPCGSTEVAFSLHGLEYARVRQRITPGSFTRMDEIVFGAGLNETVLDDTTQDLFLDLVDRLVQSRCPDGSANDPLYRLQPERWLESVLRRELSVLDLSLTGPIYSQVPAFTTGSRSLLDLLTVNRQGRLAVLELKADDDLHLPLQALDYWSRVRRLHRDGEIKKRGYFPGTELSPEEPLLYLVAPALHVHPANETILSYLAPGVPWEFIALDEHWRQKRRVVLRKRANPSSTSSGPFNIRR